VNQLRVGDVSSSDNVAGQTEWEFVRWTNAGEFAPVPEPSTYAMLFGVAALGLALYHRRRKQE